MGVVINDFDVTAEGSKETAGAESQPSASQPAAALTPRDAWDLFIYQAERWERVRAD